MEDGNMLHTRPGLASVIVILIALVASAMVMGAEPATITDDGYKARFDAAIGLHDRGQYEAAIGAFRDLLAAHPDDPNVLCELANSCLAAVKPDEAAQYAERGLALPRSSHAFCSNVLGAALDAKGDLKKGEKVFRKAIKESPQVSILHFNLGVNQSQQDRIPDAIEEFQEAIRLDPDHAGSWCALAIAWQNTKVRPRAFAAFARFLTLEPTGARAEWAAKQLGILLYRGVEFKGVDPATGKENTNITIDTDAGKKDTEAGALEMSMSLVAAGRRLDEWKDQSDNVFFAHAFESVMSIFEELGAKDNNKDRFWGESVLPYFREARQAGHLEAMAWDIRRSQKDTEIAAWLEAHADQVGIYRTWSSAWKPAGR
jgi:Tfp pilus assembly protein PilF